MPMPKFEPTPEQRETVRAMAVAKKSQEVIARAITNPRTGRGIGVKVLRKLFPSELIADVELLVGFYRNLKQALDDKEVWATKYVGDHIAELKDREKDPVTPDPLKKEIEGITVRFITSPHANDPRPVDITPRPTPPWPKSIEYQTTPQPAEKQPETIDSRDPMFIKPLATEVPQPQSNEPEPFADMGEALFRPLNGTYRNEVDITLEKRKLDMSPGAVQRRAERLRAWKR
jgi:hypothetical protein